jgi:hypothetical protein
VDFKAGIQGKLTENNDYLKQRYYQTGGRKTVILLLSGAGR